MRFTLFLSALVFGVSCVDPLAKEPIFGRKCGPNEKGQEEIKWYMDMDRNEPFPFKYLGCGETNGVDYGRASSAGKMGYVACPGYVKDSGRCVLESTELTAAHLFGKRCKSDETCQPMPRVRGIGMCCRKDAEKKYNEDQEAKCPGGSRAVLNENIEWIKRPLFGKTCSHNFCPSNSMCFQGHYEAYCCRKQ